MRRLLLPVIASIVAAVIAAGCGSSGGTRTSAPVTTGGAQTATTPPPASSSLIVIKNFAYSPSTLTVSPGAVVTVRNEDTAIHTVTAVAPHSGAFDTGDIQPGAAGTFKAPSAPGTYSYICSIHQFMHGSLVVR